MKPFDLVDEMMWEDLTDFLTLEEANLEERSDDMSMDCVGVARMVEWYLDGEEYC